MRLLVTTVLLCSAACTTTGPSTWRKPGIGPLRLQKLAIIAPVNDEAVRRSIEDRLVTELGGGRAIASYPLLGGVIDETALKGALVARGCDGAIFVHIAAVDPTADSAAGPESYVFGMWPYYEPGAIGVSTHVRVETHIYALPDEELLFASTSSPVNVINVRALVEETVKAVRKELETEGLMPKPVAWQRRR